MKEPKSVMQIVSGIYFLLMAVGLFLWIHFFTVERLVKNFIPLALGCIVLWFLLIYVVMKRQSKKRTNRKDESE